MPISRAALGLATPLVVLLAYPVVAIFFAMLPLLVVVPVCGADILRSLNRQSWARRLGVAGFCALRPGVPERQRLPLGQELSVERTAGAARRFPHLRLPAEDAATYRWLAERLHADCDTFVSLPGLNSFYFWAEKLPLRPCATRRPG